ncbi:MAG: S-layer homology domain-containing protein [Cyanobacteria bacterium P01_F01_bin.150]
MKIATVALWSVGLCSSGVLTNSAYAATDPEATDSVPSPNLSSENEAALPFISLETLPSELDAAIALESSLEEQSVIEWSPSLESPAFDNTFGLDFEEEPINEEALANLELVNMEKADAIAPTMPIVENLNSMPEWSATSHSSDVVDVNDTSAVSNVSPLPEIAEEEDVSLLPEIAEAAEEMETISTLSEITVGAASISPLPDTSENKDAEIVLSESRQIGFAPASSTVFKVAQVSNVLFPDIAAHWARGFIEPLEENGVVAGFPNGTFQPDVFLTRAEFAALLDQSFQLNPIRSSQDFVDVPSSHWASDAIDAAYRSGLISGQSNVRFAPNQSLSRVDTLTALANGLALTPSANAPQLSDYFDDAGQIPVDSRNAIAAALENEMVVNYPQIRRFRPNDATTRAEATAFLHQALVHLNAIAELDPNLPASQYIVMPNVPALTEDPSGDRPLTESEIDEVRRSLDNILESLESDQGANLRRSSPAITISNPSGFGADNFTGFVNFSYQSRTRFGNQDDGTAGIGIGVGDAQENVGLQLSYTLASFGGSRDFGSGGFNAKLHRQLPDRWGLALGWEGFLNIGGDNDFEDTIYGSVSKVIETREDVTAPFSRVALSAGVGNGRFRTEEDFNEGNDTISPFGSVAFLLAPPITSIVEWTGQDLAAGLSIAPFKDFPLVITPAVRDITGAGDGARFIISSGLSWKF